MSYETAITVACLIAAAIIIRIAFHQPITVWEELMRAKLAAYPDKHYYGSLASELSELAAEVRNRAECAEAALEESRVWEGITKERGDYWRDRYYAAISGEADTEEPIEIHAEKLNALDTSTVPNAMSVDMIDEATGITSKDIEEVRLDGAKVDLPYAYNIAEGWVDAYNAQGHLKRRVGTVTVKVGDREVAR